jgi:HNH endonuclease
MIKRRTKTRTIRERFGEKIQVDFDSGCWIFIGSILDTGYGSFWWDENEENVTAHVAAYRLFLGPIPSDKWVLHSCDVRRCVNPNHLSLGTPSENTMDAVRRDRWHTGDRHWRRKDPQRSAQHSPNRKLSDEQIQDILTSGDTKADLAKRHDIGVRHVFKILSDHRGRVQRSDSNSI